MRIASGMSMVALALALAVGMTSMARAEDAKATGTVSGKVVNAEGKAVKGAQVAAVKPMARGEGRPAAGADRPAPLAKATTGEDGTYKLEAVPVGKVMIVATAEGAGRGRSAEAVEVTAGADTKVADIKLGQRGGGRAASRRGPARR